MSTDRAPAQYCPYCGETNLFPHEEGHGSWECRECRRVFGVRFIGIASVQQPAVTDPDADISRHQSVTDPDTGLGQHQAVPDPDADIDSNSFPPVVAVQPSISGGTS